MESNQKKLIAEFVKKERLIKGLTQKELSERTNISIRSIQRIENAELIPRSYTLKSIAGALGISLDNLQLPDSAETATSERKPRSGKAAKVILSIGFSLIILFLSIAFVLQAPTFPETSFEGLLFFTGVTAMIMLLLFLIWRKQ